MLTPAKSPAPCCAMSGCSYVIVGHSERRALYGETDSLVAAKFQVAQRAGLTPILCVGETLAQREAEQTRSVVGAQLTAVIEAAGVRAFAKAVVAYEPVWAIGTGRTATPEQAQEVHAFIRGIVAARDATIAAGLSILYGGSVKGANARNLFAMGDIRRWAGRRRITRRGGVPRDLPRGGPTKSDSKMLQTIILVAHVGIALLIIGLVLLQRGKGADAGTGFGAGASGTVFGARGSATFFSRATGVLATLFFVTSFGLGLSRDAANGAIAVWLDSAPVPQSTAPAPATQPVPGASELPALQNDAPAEPARKISN